MTRIICLCYIKHMHHLSSEFFKQSDYQDRASASLKQVFRTDNVPLQVCITTKINVSMSVLGMKQLIYPSLLKKFICK